MITTLEKVRSLTAGLREREQQEATDLAALYRQLVRDVTDGKALDPERVIEQLSACGRTAEDLEADCVQLTARRDKFSRLEAARKIVSVVPALQAEQARNFEESEIEYRAWQAKWNERAESIRVKLQEANRADTQITILTEQLQKSAWPEMQARLADIQRRRAPYFDEWQQLHYRLSEGYVEHLAQQQAVLQQQLDEFKREEAAVREEMILP